MIRKIHFNFLSLFYLCLNGKFFLISASSISPPVSKAKKAWNGRKISLILPFFQATNQQNLFTCRNWCTINRRNNCLHKIIIFLVVRCFAEPLSFSRKFLRSWVSRENILTSTTWKESEKKIKMTWISPFLLPRRVQSEMKDFEDAQKMLLKLK